MTLNKHQGIRAALAWMEDLADLAKRHNNANFLVLPARFISEFLAKSIVDAYLSAPFEGVPYFDLVYLTMFNYLYKILKEKDYTFFFFILP